MCDNVEEEKCEEESFRLTNQKGVADFTLNKVDNKSGGLQEEEVAQCELLEDEGWPSQLPSELMMEHVTARVSRIEKKLVRRVQIAEVAAAQTKLRFKNMRREKYIKFIDDEEVRLPTKQEGSESGPQEGAKLGCISANEP